MDEDEWDNANRLTLGDLVTMVFVTLGCVALVVAAVALEDEEAKLSCQTPVSTTGFPVDPQCMPQGLR